ncbi:MAG: proton-conducting transporter membrane subunit [Gemmataceae bacterium]
MPEMQLTEVLGYLIVAAPAVLVALLGLPSLLGRPLSEQAITRCVQVTVWTGLAALLVLAGVMAARGEARVSIGLGNWVVIPHYHFSVKLLFDSLSVPFALLSYLLCGTIGAFSSRYLHREPGFNRFFNLYAAFFLGMVVAALADTIETLFTGWELVGLSSALLVAFFQERPAPPRNGLRVWVVYRISDAALLLAAVFLHHLVGEGDFDRLLAGGVDGHGVLLPEQAVVVGTLLLIAAAGKSALVPFSGWLPRAMEGPTPSSAVFYGALSVHLGAYLLLRLGPVISASPWLGAAVITLGLTTAVFAYLAGSVQTDIKSALSFASLTQVGLIVAEIGLGWRYVPLAHILGHACLRTLQMIRAPTLLQDYRGLENAIGGRLPLPAVPWARFVPERTRLYLYRLALERGYLDSWLDEFVVVPFVRLFGWFDRLERRWTAFLNGPPQTDTAAGEGSPTVERREPAEVGR